MTRTRRVVRTRHEQIAALGALGLAAVPASVLLAVVAHPSSSVEELSEHSGLDRRQVREALRLLQTDGLVVRSAGEFATYQAVSPDSALTERVAEAESAAAEARDVVRELDRVHRNAERSAHPASKVEVITGAENIVSRIRTLEAAARREVWVFDTPPYASRLEDYQDAIDTGMSAGVKYRAVYDERALSVPGRLTGDIARSAAAGESSRVVPTLPVKMVIIDRTTAVIPQTARGNISDSAYLIRPCALLDALIELFETTWSNALPLMLNGPQTAAGPDDDQRVLLDLLIAGHTDESIGRLLSISSRTAQRRARTLMERLNARTRFQAGAAAVLRGWVASD